MFLKYQLINSRNEALGDKLALEVRMGLDDMGLHKTEKVMEIILLHT